MSDATQEEQEEELNDPGNEDPGSLMDEVLVPLIEGVPSSIESPPQEK
ncbi:hypothetical protein [Pseudomonas sp. 18175]